MAAILSACHEPRPDRSLDIFESTYAPRAAPPYLIRNATILDGLGGEIADADLLMANGEIVAFGPDIMAPADAVVIDGEGRSLTPGIIDVHTHYGTATLPYALGSPDHWDVNEASHPVTPQIRIETAFNPQDPALFHALSGGVTTFQVLPGSRNAIGGLGVVMKNVLGPTPQSMKFPDAPYGLKMACGENPKAYGIDGRAPYSRMGVVSLQRQAWQKALDYAGDADAPRDLGLDVLAAALDGDVMVHAHCYRADDMSIMMDMANEFGFEIAAFHHAVEAYKIPDQLAEQDICSAVWSDWWGWKLEAFDGIPENAAYLHASGACVMMHSDVPALGGRLNIEVAKAVSAGRDAGIELTLAEALAWITSEPAKLLGIADHTGSIKTGLNADLVLWSGDPFSVYSHADLVFIDGVLVFDRDDPAHLPHGDFMIGQPSVTSKP
jgi:imidazolonepropionase-like amidohydrolase